MLRTWSFSVKCISFATIALFVCNQIAFADSIMPPDVYVPPQSQAATSALTSGNPATPSASLNTSENFLSNTTPLIAESDNSPQGTDPNRVYGMDGELRSELDSDGGTIRHVYAGESIQGTVDQSASGDTVFIHAGTYHEKITLQQGVSLQGEDAETTVIHGDFQTDANVVRALGHNRIEGLTLTGGGPYAGAPASAIRVEGDSVQIRGNRFVDNQDYGIHVWNGADTLIEMNFFKDTYLGVQLPKDTTVIRYNTFVKCRIGVNVLSGARSLIRGNIFTESTFASIYEFSWAAYSSGQPSRGFAVVEENTFWKNTERGSAYGSATPPAAANQTAGNLNADPGFINAMAGDYAISEASASFGRGAFLPSAMAAALTRASTISAGSTIQSITEGSTVIGYRVLYDEGSTESFYNDGRVVLDTTPPEIVVSSAELTRDPAYILTFTKDGAPQSQLQTLVEGDNTLTITAQDIFGNTCSVSFHVVLDRVAPLGTVTINGGADTTASRSVVLQLTATDASSGSDLMRFSTDGGETWTEWETSKATKALILPEGVGSKEVQYQIKDRAGNVSETYSDTISYENGVPAGPAVVSVAAGDYRLFVQERLSDGTLGAQVAYVSKGVNWAPSSVGTTEANLNLEYIQWYETDLPLMAQMGVNTVRVDHDFGTGAAAIRILDEMWKLGIKVIMTVDSPQRGVSGSLANISAIVNAYKDHPAILMWSVGNEWDVNKYSGAYATLAEAAAFTEQAAQLIKSIDVNHPVTTVIVDPQTVGVHPLSDELSHSDYDTVFTDDIVNTMVPGVDVWGVNLDRGDSFQDALAQWKQISNKPLYIAGFGADSYDHRDGSEDQAMQADMNARLLDEVYFELSAERTDGALVGALVSGWNDEWWRDGSVSTQSVGTTADAGQLDGYRDAEWFGIVDIHRNVKQAYSAIQSKFLNWQGSVQMNATPVITVTSQESSSARIQIGDKTVYYRRGMQFGGRGVTVATIDPNTGIRLNDVRTFDTWMADNGWGSSHSNFLDLMSYLESIPDGAIVAISIADEGGFKAGPGGALWNETCVYDAVAAIEALGSTSIRDVDYGGGWAMIAVKGQGKLAENFSAPGSVAVAQYQLSLTVNVDAGRRETVIPTVPTVEPSPYAYILTTDVRLSGTKDANTSIWINGSEVVPLDSSTSWSVWIPIPLEGDNTFTVTSRNALGHSSQAVSVVRKRDTVAPDGSVVINHGEASTNSATVLLTLTGSDATAGLNGMRFSTDDCLTWSDWETFSDSKTVTLSPGDGVKYVFYQLRDMAGRIAPYWDQILYNAGLSAPAVTSTVPGVTNQTALVLSGTKDAQTSVWINGVEVVTLNSSTTWTATVDLTTEGSNVFTITSKNGSGVESGALVLNVTRDMVAPAGSVLINNGDATTTSLSVNLTLTGSDATAGLDAMSFSVDGGMNWSGWEDFSTTKAVMLTSGYGTKTVQYRLRDKAMNIATYSDTITYDVIPTTPVITSTVPEFTNQTTLVISGTKEANTSILVNGVEKVASNSSTTWSVTVNLTAEGANTFVIKSKNSSGVESGSVSVSPIRDTVKPTGSVNINSGAAYSASQTVTLNLSGTDATSGMDKMSFSNDNSAWTTPEAYAATKSSYSLSAGDGTKTVYVKYYDKAGNVSVVYSKTIVLDATAPTGSLNINSGATYATSQIVTLNLSGTDATSGMDKMSFSNDNVTWTTAEAYATTKSSYSLSSGDGTKTVYVKYYDKAGNVSAVYSKTIVLDTAAPTGTVQISGGAAYTNATGVTLNLTMSDALSGLADVQFSTNGTTWSAWQAYSATVAYTLVAGDGTKTVYVKVRDQAGNIMATAVSDTIVLDTVKPTGSISINGGAATTTSRDVTLNLTAADATSGTNGMRLSTDGGTTWTSWEPVLTTKALTLSAGAGTKEVQYQVKDNAGNISTTYTDTITYELGVPAAPSVVTVQAGDRRLFVQNRLEDGSLAPVEAYVAKGVNWSPTSYNTNPSADPLAFRKGFQTWYQTDIPMMAQMGINTVRVYHDFGTDANAIKVLDMLYQYGIKVIMTVDSPKSTVIADVENISIVVNAYKNHPAILMWSVGNEWDLVQGNGKYYWKYDTLADAANFVEQAARTIKQLDGNHPVTTVVADSVSAATAASSLVPAIDVWGINIYRGQTFGEAISQWEAVSGKPFYIGEYGADSYDHRIGAENQSMQAQMDGQLWDEVYFDLSAERTDGALVGALAFEWSDEWWKNSVDGIHSITTEPNGGQLDGYNDEEWFGIVDVNRNVKQVYSTMQGRFLNPSANVQMNATPLITVSSQVDTYRGSVRVDLDDKLLTYSLSRGITVAVIDVNTGIRLSDVRSFDTWWSAANMTAMINYINSLPVGSALAISIADEGGFTDVNGNPRNDPAIEQAYQLFESLGSTKVRQVKYWYGWAMIAVKGRPGPALAEAISVPVSQNNLTPVTVSARLSLTLNPDAGRRTASAAAVLYAEPEAKATAVSVATMPVISVTAQSAGVSSVSLDGKTVLRRQATQATARGVQVVAFDPRLGTSSASVRSFDVSTSVGMSSLNNYLNDLASGTAVTMSLSGGIATSSAFRARAVSLGFYKTMEALGSTKIRKLGDLGSWAMVAIKGQGIIAEAYSDPRLPVILKAQLPEILGSNVAKA